MLVELGRQDRDARFALRQLHHSREALRMLALARVVQDRLCLVLGSRALGLTIDTAHGLLGALLQQRPAVIRPMRSRPDVPGIRGAAIAHLVTMLSNKAFRVAHV